MQVFTHYPALAVPIRRAGYEPVLLKPLQLEPGPVVVAPAGRGEVVVSAPNANPLVVRVQEE